MRQDLRHANTPGNYYPLSPSVGFPCKEATAGLWFPSHVEACRGHGLHVSPIKAAALRLPAGPRELGWESTSCMVENRGPGLAGWVSGVSWLNPGSQDPRAACESRHKWRWDGERVGQGFSMALSISASSTSWSGHCSPEKDGGDNKHGFDGRKASRSACIGLFDKQVFVALRIDVDMAGPSKKLVSNDFW